MAVVASAVASGRHIIQLYVYSFPLQLIIAGWALAFLTSAPSAVAARILTLAITAATVFISLMVAELSYRSVEFPAMLASQRQIRVGERSARRDRDLPAHSR
jgi:hypothetical protein